MKRTVTLISLALCCSLLLGCSNNNKTSKTDSNTSATFTTSKQPGQSTIQEVYDFLKKCQTYYLATVEGDQPRVRPFGTVELFEGKLYIQTGKVKAVSKQIQANPNVELCAFCDGKWLRVSGKLVRDDRVEAKKHMLDNYPSLQKMYSAEDDNTEVLYFEDATATFNSFGDELKVVKFGSKNQ
mgnify:CR=1 FL=1|jgi:uncharacterized pyridoxamine 5'-phosphate oxidase family protein